MRATTARSSRARALRSSLRRKDGASPSSRAAIPACSPWRRRCFEAIEHGEPARGAALDVRVVPGITAMQAAAARIGAPLGHDFCAISLSDNLKPWAIIEKRLEGGERGRFRDRALQPGLEGAGPNASRKPLPVARPQGRRDARDLRARRRPREDERITVTESRRRPIPPSSTWRRSSSSARARRA